ncbi:MAG: right-handed parallel beta-helix repeat-containing protein [Bacteroidetes bacterium]|nr:right-handed parallel beta-helix repeat-containing protein [Bacteroidota bacterium]
MKTAFNFIFVIAVMLLSASSLSAQTVRQNMSGVTDDNPNLPTELSFMPNIPLPAEQGTNGASGDGRYLYVSLFNRDVQVYDLQNINSPLMVSKIEGVVPAGEYLGRTFYYNNLLFVSDWSKNLHIYDCSDPSNPTEKSTTVIGGNIVSMSFEGNYAHLLLRYVTGLENSKSKFVILDISDPQNLQIKSELIVEGTGQNHYYSAARKLAYIRGHSSGVIGALTTLDLSNINLPQILNVTSEYFNQMVGFDDYFIVTKRNGNQSTLYVYSTTDASNPVLVKSFQLPVNRVTNGMADVNGALLVSTYMPVSPYTYTILTYVYDETSNEFLAGPTIDDTEGWGAEEFVLFKEPLAKTGNLYKSSGVNVIKTSSTTYYAVYGYGSPPQRVIAMEWPEGTLEPVLTVSGARRNDIKCPTEAVQGEYYNTGIITITADDVADWSLGGFKLDASGNGDDKLDIANVLIQGAATVATQYSDDDGAANVSFSPPIIVARGTSQVFTVSYSFAFDPEIYGYDTVKVFNWKTTGVTATPLEYEPGSIQGQARMDSLIFARVQTSRNLVFAKIQDAINSDQTLDGDRIVVCNGLYEEQLVVDKELYVKSKNGPEETIIYPFLNLPDEEEAAGIFLSRNNTTFEGFTIYGAEDSDLRDLVGIAALGDNVIIKTNYLSSFASGILVEIFSEENSLNKYSREIQTDNSGKKSNNSETILISENGFEDIKSLNAIEVNNYSDVIIEKNFFNTEEKDSYMKVENPGNLTISENQSMYPLIIAIIDTMNNDESDSGLIEVSDNEIASDTTGGIAYLGDGKGNRMLIKLNKKFDIEIDKCADAELVNNTVPNYLALYSPNGEIDLVDNIISGNVFIENVNNSSPKTAKLNIRNNFFESDTTSGLILRNVSAGTDTSVKHLILKNQFEGKYFEKIELRDVYNAQLDSNTIHGKITIHNSSDNIIQNNQILGHDVHSYGVDIRQGSRNNIISKNLINGFTAAGINGGQNIENTRIEFNFIGTDEEGTVAIRNVYGIILDGSANVTIEDNLISGNSTGIMIEDLCEDILIKNNIIGPSFNLTERFECNEGIFVKNSNKNITVEGNNISGLSQGIKFRHTIYNSFSSKLENIIIRNNLFGVSSKLTNLCGISVWDGFSNNHIENNRMNYNGAAILMEGEGVEKNTIKDNIIGLNEAGTDLGVVLQGITLKHGPSDNTIENNTVASAYSIMIGGDNTEKNVVRNNTIGLDINGAKSLFNDFGIAIAVGAKNNTVENNVIGGSNSAISIVNQGTSNNIIQDNIIGTDRTFSKKYPIANFGVLIIDGATNNIIRNNTIGPSDSAAAIQIQGFNTSRNLVYVNNLGTNTDGNVMLPNPIGLVLLKCSNNTITLNKIWYNRTGIYALNSSNTVFQNDIQHCTGNTGIHLENSNTEIIGNVIANDATDAIKCTDGSNPKISANNIYNNSGFGLLNNDSNTKINADGNWWGNASGPSGIGSGSGEKVGGNVNITNWLSSESKLILSAATDTLFIMEKGSDSLSIFYSNRENQSDVLTMTISSDKDNWIIGDRIFPTDMSNAITCEKKITFVPSLDAVNGDIAKIFLSVSSQSNPSLEATDTFYVAVYKSSLHYLRVNPDTLKCSVGEIAQFHAFGYDIVNNSFPVEVVWSTNGGTIDSSGLYTAGTNEGIFLITAKDKYSETTSTAFVQIGEITVSVEEIDSKLPKEFVLSKNYPNPFNPTTKINYSLPVACNVSLKVYDILGGEVAVLVNKEQAPGNYKAEFNASKFASGVYIYRLHAVGRERQVFVKSSKMILIK